tara:strand:- start:91 stop:927 length:837 start_codon:yes stop_codon:yes gene_type:complete
MISFHPSSEFKPENQNSSDLERIYLVLRDGKILTVNGSNIAVLTKEEYTWSGMESLQELFIGYVENKACYVIELTNTSPCLENTQLSPLQSLLGAVPDNIFTICSRSLQLIDWFKHHQFCGRCGNKMNMHETERAMSCSCNAGLNYPKISPCVIVLVTKKNDLLLAHNKNFPGKFYSTLAGFIEPGETAEDAIHREIEEEVSIKVKNIKYYGSQSWPFPSQLMLGYHAEYESGEILPDGEEIDEADWFNYLQLPAVPSGKISISGRLIEHFLDIKKNN